MASIYPRQEEQREVGLLRVEDARQIAEGWVVEAGETVDPAMRERTLVPVVRSADFRQLEGVILNVMSSNAAGSLERGDACKIERDGLVPGSPQRAQ